MGAQRLNLPHYTYEDYCQWEGRWELIYGIPFAMSPAPVEQHQIVGGNLFYLFKLAFKDRCNDCRPVPPIHWKVYNDTILQPDFLVICGPAVEKGPLAFSPALVAEILSPSSVIKDRNDKFTIYQLEQVKYYLILDANLKKLEVYELINRKYELVAITPSYFEFTFHDNCKVPINFDELWD